MFVICEFNFAFCESRSFSAVAQTLFSDVELVQLLCLSSPALLRHHFRLGFL